MLIYNQLKILLKEKGFPNKKVFDPTPFWKDLVIPIPHKYPISPYDIIPIAE